MKPQLTYIIKWNKVDKTKTWSGTGYSIYKALKKYFEVEDIPIPEDNLFYKCYKKLIGGKSSSHTKDILKKRKFLNNICKEKMVFQFAEYVNHPSAKTYIYQDLNVEYLLMLSRNNQELYQYAWGNKCDANFWVDRCNLQNEYYQSATGIFCMGHWLKEYLIKECNIPYEKVVHVGGGINLKLDKIHPTKNKTKTKILFVGRDFKRKGGFITIEAFKLLKRQMPNAELFVAGPKENPIKENIAGFHYLGDLNFDEVNRYFNECDIFCMPSYFEAYGLVFVEALASGLPCIGRDCYEMPYFIEEGKTGLLLKNDSAEELAGKMYELLTNDTYKNNVAAKKEWYIKEYSWDTVAERMYRFITQ